MMVYTDLAGILSIRAAMLSALEDMSRHIDVAVRTTVLRKRTERRALIVAVRLMIWRGRGDRWLSGLSGVCSRGRSKAKSRDGRGWGIAVLGAVALMFLLPQRLDYLEEQRAYLWDLPTSRSRAKWVCAECVSIAKLTVILRWKRSERA
ncbi:hypothetical protein DZF91_18280 [Actinomadura logoneensis]|uniref:Uncharacterized protein n=1 Tax=Actinomadura logoneensis TaxID=2293572 RepID=A0A372JK91_9ACTN|nr:hypothetical protein [Actinomadura logoneensis]RFU40226.1 hypothetical protein DZF91_18280 [Actinomadura logoneensis]